MKSTNYTNTFIAVADTCKNAHGVEPPHKKIATVAALEFEMISQHPYQFTADEVQYEIYKKRHGNISLQDFFNKNLACFRCSPLAQRYGWGMHFNENSKVALVGKNSVEYLAFKADQDLIQKKAYSSQQ